VAIRVFHPSPLRYSSAGDSWRLCESCITNYHEGGMHKPNAQLASLSTMASYGHNLVLHGNIKCHTDFSTAVWNQENRSVCGVKYGFLIFVGEVWGSGRKSPEIRRRRGLGGQKTTRFSFPIFLIWPRPVTPPPSVIRIGEDQPPQCPRTLASCRYRR
jgi:hypothetical protein